MIYSKTKNFVFFMAGKVASTSMEAALLSYKEELPFTLTPEEDKFYNKHMPPAEFMRKAGKAAFDSLFKIEFVRNPYDYVVSQCLYNRMIGLGEKLTARKVREMMTTVTREYSRGVKADVLTQFSTMTLNGQILVDFIGRFENLQSDFDAVCDRIGVPRRKLPKLYASNPGIDWREFYTDDVKHYVYELFKEDFLNFGYDDELGVSVSVAVTDRGPGTEPLKTPEAPKPEVVEVKPKPKKPKVDLMTPKKTKIIVPYRKRARHLKKLEAHLASFLDFPYEIVVVEQADTKLFNKGRLMNIAMHEIQEQGCLYAMHDVDILEVRADYSVPPPGTIAHLSREIEQFGYKMPYDTYFGGVLLFHGKDFRAVNGFSNEYWGWGCEDDDFYIRCVANGLEIDWRPGRYDSLAPRSYVMDDAKEKLSLIHI